MDEARPRYGKARFDYDWAITLFVELVDRLTIDKAILVILPAEYVSLAIFTNPT